MTEEWRDVAGYEGLYQISNYGNVKSVARADTVGRKRKERLLTQTNSSWGYKCVKLCNGETQKTVRVHRLVADAFIPNPDHHPCVNHKDEDKNNNRADNLEWCSWRYNAIYGHRLDSVSGENYTKSKLSKDQVIRMKESYIPYDPVYGVTALAKEFGVSLTTARRVIHGETHKKILQGG